MKPIGSSRNGTESVPYRRRSHELPVLPVKTHEGTDSAAAAGHQGRSSTRASATDRHDKIRAVKTPAGEVLPAGERSVEWILVLGRFSTVGCTHRRRRDHRGPRHRLRHRCALRAAGLR